LGLLLVAGMVRIILAPFVVVVFEVIGTRIMRDFFEFTDLMLL